MSTTHRQIVLFLACALLFSGSSVLAACLSGDCTNGMGKATLAGIKTFDGQFKDGKPSGKGTMSYAPGYSIDGNFDGWTPYGNGDLTCQDGTKHYVNFDDQDKTPTDICSPPKNTFTRDQDKEMEQRLERLSIHLRNEEIALKANKQRKAARQGPYDVIQPTTTIITTTSSGIRGKCQNEWGTNYLMVESCIKTQMEALRNVTAMPENNIKNKCKNEWGTNYLMVESCIKVQSEAKNRLGM